MMTNQRSCSRLPYVVVDGLSDLCERLWASETATLLGVVHVSGRADGIMRGPPET